MLGNSDRKVVHDKMTDDKKTTENDDCRDVFGSFNIRSRQNDASHASVYMTRASKNRNFATRVYDLQSYWSIGARKISNVMVVGPVRRAASRADNAVIDRTVTMKAVV